MEDLRGQLTILAISHQTAMVETADRVRRTGWPIEVDLPRNSFEVVRTELIELEEAFHDLNPTYYHYELGVPR